MARPPSLRALVVLFLLVVLSVAAPKGLTGKGPLTVKQAHLKKEFEALIPSASTSLRHAQKAREVREQRAKYRQTQFVRPTGAALHEGSSFCEQEAVGPLVRRDYGRRVSAFESLCLLLGFEPVPSDAFQNLILEFMDELFFRGHPVEDGQKLIAAIKHTFPQYGRGGPLHLARAERALRGWSRHSPTRVRAPMPVQIMAAMVGYMLTRGWVWAALALVVGFVTYLRPGELFGLKQKHLIPSFPSAGLVHWGIVYRLIEDNQPTKTGEFEEAVLLDGQWSPWLGAILAGLHSRLRPEDSLWTGLSSETMVNMFRVTTQKLHITVLNLEWYCVRHGGASFDAAFKHRAAEEIQKRLRHSSINTVRRYEKAAKISAELAKAPGEIVEYGQRVLDQLPLVFTNRRCLPALPPSVAT